MSVTVQGDPSTVARGFTTKLPVAVPELTVHDGLVISDAPFDEPLGLGVDVRVHDVSVLPSPKPRNVTVTYTEPYVGVSVNERV